MFKRVGVFSFLVVLLVFAPFFQTQPINGDVSTSGKVGNGNDETPGEWTIYDTPPNLQEDKPILLFVPGLNNVAQIFWNVDNSMAEAAYDAGYQAVFIQLNDAGGASADMWDNGELLADKIVEISNHFNGKPITVVAYSKGGVDTQTALTYYGVSHLVDRVITLSSPHHGSELANLAYSSGAEWLADLIGATGDGTYVMQTGYMENFRQETDAHQNAYLNNYYTLGGTSWGSMFSANWFGGMYLSTYGSNDGVVTVNSSRLPGGQELAVGNWNHTNIRTGITFPTFANYLSTNSSSNIQDSVDRNDSLEQEANRFIQGGPMTANEHVEIPHAVEDGVEQLTYTIFTAHPLSDIRLIDDRAHETKPKIHSTKIDEGILQGAYAHSFQVEQPEAGTWQLELEATIDNAYLLMVDYETENLFKINERTEKDLSDIQHSRQYRYHIETVSETVDLDSIEATYHVVNTKSKEQNVITEQGEAALLKTLTFSDRDTVYNITIELEGRTKQGEKFNRTIIDSIYIP